MPCDVIALNNNLLNETGRIMPGEILSRLTAREPWDQLTKKDVWPDEMGAELSNALVEMSAPTWTSPTRRDAPVTSIMEGGSCLPPVVTVPFGIKTFNFRLRQTAFETGNWCLETVRTAWDLQNQLGRIYDSFAGYMDLAKSDFAREDYFTAVQTKVVANPVPTEDDTGASSYPAVLSTSVLTQGLLDRYRENLRRLGADREPLGMQNNAPILGLIASGETIEMLRRVNSDLRDDTRYAYMGQAEQSPLLKGMGALTPYRGFYHLETFYPRRFNFTGGVYVQAQTWETVATTTGMSAQLTTAWKTATHEESYIYTPLVHVLRFPNLITSPGGNQSYMGGNYVGDWQWKNIPSRDCNPDGTVGYFRARYYSASEIKKPYLGVAIIHKRVCIPIQAITSSGC